MPTTSCCCPSTSIELPTIEGSDANRRCQSPCPSTTRRCRPVVSSSGRKPRPMTGCTPKHRKEVGRDEEPLHVLRLVLADEVRRPPFEGGEALEHVRLLFQVEKVGRGDGFAPVLTLGPRVRQQRDPVDVAHRERPQHERIDHREDGRVGAQAEAEREHDDGADGRALAGCCGRHGVSRGRGCA